MTPYQEGYNSFFWGIYDNPYIRYSDEWSEWEEGWLKALLDNE